MSLNVATFLDEVDHFAGPRPPRSRSMMCDLSPDLSVGCQATCQHAESSQGAKDALLEASARGPLLPCRGSQRLGDDAGV